MILVSRVRITIFRLNSIPNTFVERGQVLRQSASLSNVPLSGPIQKTYVRCEVYALDPKPSSLHLRNCLIGARLDTLSLHHEAKRTKVHIER